MKKPQIAVTLILMALLLSATALADDIPFDTNVPDPSGGNWSSAPENITPPPVAKPGAPAPKTTTPPPTAAAAAPTPAPAQATNQEVDNPSVQGPPAMAPISPGNRTKGPAELSGLGKLAPFSDIAVITKRFLPKTHRFEFFPNLGLVANDAFFSDYIFGGRLAYSFSEKYTLEANAFAVATSPKTVTDELQNPRGINTATLASPQSYFGLDFKWSPIYGKLGFLGKKIVPFDFYFSGGAGITQTNQGTSPPTIHLGVGQLYAIKKWMGFRWDFSWYGYNSTSTVGVSASSPPVSQFFSNLNVTIGMSFFFPSAEYR